MHKPTLEEVKLMTEKFNKISVYKEIPAGDLLPVTAILKLGLENKRFILLESGKGPGYLSRYSYIGFEPEIIFNSKGEQVTLQEKGKTIQQKKKPYQALIELMNKYKAEKIPGLPEFYGGAVGYFSYDMGRFFEQMPELAEDDLGLPESFFMLVDKVICFDNVENIIKIIVNINPEEFAGIEQGYLWAKKEIDRIEKMVQSPKVIQNINILEKAWQKKCQTECNVTKEQFEDMVNKAKEYIKAGDIFQVNLSLRLGQRVDINPFDLYRVLREVNPSPYMCFINFGELQIVGSSPELLVRIRDNWAETRPIAGTRRRGNSREEDLALSRELINNEKERAEHIMLVDLERNDLGRVCSYGSVEVNELMVIEEYSHVMHIVSNVRGKLAEKRDRFDLLQSCFPGGTITGAPKIRSMEIIEELEPTRRGIYTGSIGYLGFGGEMEMNISIRSIVIKENIGYVQAGAGIVADSIPEKEYFESMKKAEALLRAIELANEMFNK